VRPVPVVDHVLAGRQSRIESIDSGRPECAHEDARADAVAKLMRSSHIAYIGHLRRGIRSEKEEVVLRLR
jgi:hypothetical protein